MAEHIFTCHRAGALGIWQPTLAAKFDVPRHRRHGMCRLQHNLSKPKSRTSQKASGSVLPLGARPPSLGRMKPKPLSSCQRRMTSAWAQDLSQQQEEGSLEVGTSVGNPTALGSPTPHEYRSQDMAVKSKQARTSPSMNSTRNTVHTESHREPQTTRDQMNLHQQHQTLTFKASVAPRGMAPCGNEAHPTLRTQLRRRLAKHGC